MFSYSWLCYCVRFWDCYSGDSRSVIFFSPSPEQCQSVQLIPLVSIIVMMSPLWNKLFSFMEPRRKLSQISFETFSPLYCVLESAGVSCSGGLWTLAPYTGSGGLAGTSCPYLGPQAREPPWAHARPPSRVAKYGRRSVCIPADHSDIPNGRHGAGGTGSRGVFKRRGSGRLSSRQLEQEAGKASSLTARDEQKVSGLFRNWRGSHLE